MEPNQCIYVCTGSVCHRFGVKDLFLKMQSLLVEYGLSDAVELKGAFCLGVCSEGIGVRVRDTHFAGLGLHNVEERFEQEILPALLSKELL